MTGFEFVVYLLIAFCVGCLWTDWLQRRAAKESNAAALILAAAPMCVAEMEES